MGWNFSLPEHNLCRNHFYSCRNGGGLDIKQKDLNQASGAVLPHRIGVRSENSTESRKGIEKTQRPPNFLSLTAGCWTIRRFYTSSSSKCSHRPSLVHYLRPPQPVQGKAALFKASLSLGCCVCPQPRGVTAQSSPWHSVQARGRQRGRDAARSPHAILFPSPHGAEGGGLTLRAAPAGGALRAAMAPESSGRRRAPEHGGSRRKANLRTACFPLAGSLLLIMLHMEILLHPSQPKPSRQMLKRHGGATSERFSPPAPAVKPHARDGHSGVPAHTV